MTNRNQKGVGDKSQSLSFVTDPFRTPLVAACKVIEMNTISARRFKCFPNRVVYPFSDTHNRIVRLRQMLASNAELARKLAALEQKYDAQFKVVFDAIRQPMTPPEPKTKRPIGFAPREENRRGMSDGLTRRPQHIEPDGQGDLTSLPVASI